MTTIAYKDGVLAADSLATRNGAREGLSVKILRRGPLLAGATGSADFAKAFRDWFARGCKGDCPPMGDPDKNWGEGFIIMPDERLVVFGPAATWESGGLHDGTGAWGSGGEFARGAMAAGATAEEAVAAACRFDIHSGGQIITLRRYTAQIIPILAGR